ncbi:interferon-related developmental regulator 2 [Zootermopsis nevadensis]|uniref:interferon-related developmental regulator 2 n=1 Tax=Zootermopsis nevadensis TaxID=136037 RepID=UPI000B8ED0C3|nr:interferon-related developmental regulator 2 [Zootermopsis nevadensis]
MPKGKRKGKSAFVQKSRIDAIGLTSDEDSVNDNASVNSIVSETKSIAEEGGDEVDEQTQEEVFEEKLREAIDGLNQKSAQGRTLSLESVTKAFIKKCIPDFVSDRRLTLADGIERSLKKGRGSEQAAAAQLAPLLCVQLGAGDEAEEVCKLLAPVLSVVAHDTAASPKARAKCCWALGLCSFLSGGEMADVIHLMQSLETIFSGSYLKGNGTIPVVSAELSSLHAAALSAWSLLLTLMAPSDTYMLMSENSDGFASKIYQLSELLDSAHLDVRMAAGETIALAYELGREHNDDFQRATTPQLVDKLRQLATDSHKYRAKKDRKQQRSSFRDILHYVEDGDPPDIQVRFGQEILALDSWCRKKQYDAFCQVLGSGMNLHLTENDLVRDIFELGERLSPPYYAANKQTKLERHLMNAAAYKARTISRNKHRDKRSSVVAC